jgi:hypothetical protein
MMLNNVGLRFLCKVGHNLVVIVLRYGMDFFKFVQTQFECNEPL